MTGRAARAMVKGSRGRGQGFWRFGRRRGKDDVGNNPAGHGHPVVAGQHLMQAESDIFPGWTWVPGPDKQEREAAEGGALPILGAASPSQDGGTD